MSSKDPFQPKAFYDSMENSCQVVDTFEKLNLVSPTVVKTR